MTLLKLLVWILVILIFNLWDWKVTHKGGKPSYFLYNFFRVFAAILHGSLIIKSPAYTTDNWAWTKAALLAWAPILIFQITSFWIVYEIVRNIWSRKPFELLYFDRKEMDSGGIDKFFARRPIWMHTVAKVAALILAVLSGIVIYHL